MFDNFREWLSDNLRYILLGVIGVLLLLIVVFIIRAVIGGGSGEKKNKIETTQTTEAADKKDDKKDEKADDKADEEAENINEEETSSVPVSAKDYTASGRLVKDQPDILDVVTRYYNARATRDYDTLTELCEVFDEKAKAEVQSQDGAIEEYQNIIAYSKDGMDDDSYVVYTYFDAKITGINTPAPSLRELYLITNEDGKLQICDRDSNPQIQTYTEKLRTEDDVQALITDVNNELKAAEAQDSDLKTFVESGSTTLPAGAEPVSGATQTGTMQATTEVNVRGTASPDGTLYGILSTGTQVEVLENLDGGWSKIKYQVNGTTIEGYVMSQYLAPLQ